MPDAGNVISGKDVSGIRLLDDVVGGLIQGNLIGTDAKGKTAIGNLSAHCGFGALSGGVERAVVQSAQPLRCSRDETSTAQK